MNLSKLSVDKELLSGELCSKDNTKIMNIIYILIITIKNYVTEFIKINIDKIIYSINCCRKYNSIKFIDLIY